ncbi:MAG: hypothetical protein IT375_04640 [Polyangiaceae bacterium]|nr:hypothetical protein [Polyangiaceae bacterium]
MTQSLNRGASHPAGGCQESRLQLLFALTFAEARVASRLARGADLTTIAQELRVSRETVRTHLKRIYCKTGARRQAALVALVLGAQAVGD